MRSARSGLASVVLTSALLTSATAAHAEGARDVEEVEQLVVMITAELGGEQTWAAGIIVSGGQGVLTIATAAHAVRHGEQQAQHVTVQLRAKQGHPIEATVLPEKDDRLDLALLRVAGIDGLGLDVERLPFDRLGDPSNLKRGDPVYSLGFPRQRPWDINIAPDHFTERRGTRLYYQSNSIVPGHSGGALLTGEGEIVGMILGDQQPDGEAVAVTDVLAKLAEWKYSVRLRNRFALAEPELLSTGSAFTCQIVDGTGYCWGSNDKGQLGSGTLDDSARPLRIAGRTDLRSIGAGSQHACALTTDGTAYCWGDNSSGQLGNGSIDDGSRVPTPVSGGVRFVSISGGWEHTCGVTPEGDAYCWGSNDDGQLGNGSKASSPKPVRVAGKLRWRSVTAGIGYTCGLAYGGKAYCWGSNHFGHLGNGSKVPSRVPVAVAGGLSFTAVIAGNLHNCGLTKGGRAYCWGMNEWGELGNGSETASAVPVPVSGDLSFAQLAISKPSGPAHTCGVTTSGAAYCWGYASELLGSPEVQDHAKPLRVQTDTTFVAVSAGFSHSCGRAVNGTTYCWGSNRYGQLSDAASGDTWRPVSVRVPPP